MLLVSVKEMVVYVNTKYRSTFPKANRLEFSRVLINGQRPAKKLGILRVFSRLLFRKIEEDENGIRLPSRLLLHPCSSSRHDGSIALELVICKPQTRSSASKFREVSTEITFEFSTVFLSYRFIRTCKKSAFVTGSQIRHVMYLRTELW